MSGVKFLHFSKILSENSFTVIFLAIRLQCLSHEQRTDLTPFDSILSLLTFEGLTKNGHINVKEQATMVHHTTFL